LKYRVWINGREDEAREVEVIESLSSRPIGTKITPMFIRDYLCHNEIFSWRDYTDIRYKRLKS